jgi:hypothetical protein
MTKRASHRKRWKAVEVRVAAELSKIFSDVGKEPVERIPILGRTGPDITFNSIQLIVDVKSRLRVPKYSLAANGQAIQMGDLLGFQLDDMLKLADLPTFTAPLSPLVAEWIDHMDQWTAVNVPDGISCIVLHRPKMPVGSSTVVIYSVERNKLCQRLALSSPAKTHWAQHAKTSVAS